MLSENSSGRTRSIFMSSVYLTPHGSMASRGDSSRKNSNLLDEEDDADYVPVPAERDPVPGAFGSSVPRRKLTRRDLESSARNDQDTGTYGSPHSPQSLSSPPVPPYSPSVSNISQRSRDSSLRPEYAQAVHRHQDSTSRSSLSGTSGSSRVVIAIDYGTTYTGLAVAKTQSGHANLDEIEVLQNWGLHANNQPKVRTMISYANTASGERQWGSTVDNHASAMVNTKLELEPQPTRKDELELTLYLLKGTGNLAFEHLKKIGPNPAYTSAPPGQIVQDYLSHICQSARRDGVFKKTDMARLVETSTPVDIVVTVPANWSFQATDATFKAVRGAGFNKQNFPTLNDTILTTEPEAASFFAIRDHQAISNVDLRVDDCFILCDAGGGTVDVVSYQVKKVSPHLELERATEPKSDKCGSAYIDTAFKNWLRQVLGPENYAKLDPLNANGRISAHTMESGPIRDLVKQFIAKKETFSENVEDVHLDLPPPLERLDREGRVRQGELTITGEEMEELFSVCIDGVINLLDDQVKRLKKAKQRRARDVFLVGGFGASAYLQYHLDESLQLRRNSSLRCPDPDKSVTAVVQGAVIYGIEKARHTGIRYMAAVTDSYGILLHKRYHWLVRRGDLVLSNEKKFVKSEPFSLPMSAVRKFDMVIWHYKKRHEDDDEVPESWDDGQHDVEPAGVIKCDFSAMSDHELRQPSAPQQRNMFMGPFRVHFQLSSSSIDAAVLHKKRQLGRYEIAIKTDALRNSSSNDWD